MTTPAQVAMRDAMRLLDAEPVLDAELIALGRWIAGYYCAPLGEVLRGMLPLGSEIRRGKTYSLTDSGRDAARQLVLDASPDDPVIQVLRLLERRPLSASYLARVLPLADQAIKSLDRKGFIVAEDVQTERDPLRAPSERLRVSLAARPREAEDDQGRARVEGLPRTASGVAQPEGPGEARSRTPASPRVPWRAKAWSN